jgi:DNA-binding MarR family transcriptional regulator
MIRTRTTFLHGEDLGFLTHRAARLLRQRMNSSVAEFGLTAPQTAVLLALPRSEDPTPSVLAEALGIDRPTMTGLIGRLGRDGWVRLLPHPTDGRARIITPTEKTLLALPEIAEASRAVGATALEGLTESERELLLGLLARVGDTLDDHTGRNDP